MKRINPLSILFLNIIVLLIVLNLYRFSNSDVTESKKEYADLQKISNEYKNSKNSFYLNKEAQTKINKIARQVNIKDISIIKSGKKLIVKTRESSLYTQDKFLNKILNEKFIIQKLKIQKNNLEIVIGLK